MVKNTILSYFQKMGIKRLLLMFFGNVILSFGVAAFNTSAMGNTSYDGMNMAISSFFHIYFPYVNLGVNLVLFVVEYTWGKHFIGIGTLVNMCLNGFFINWFISLFRVLGIVPVSIISKLAVLIFAIILCGIGLSFYQTADAGISPYDALALILDKKLTHVSYFAIRMATDISCAAISFVLGGQIGIGTVFSMLGFGPVIAFFDKYLTRKYILPRSK